MIASMAIVLLQVDAAYAASDAEVKALREAIDHEDSLAVIAILEAAGGPLKARELAKSASGADFWASRCSYSIIADGDKETLTMYSWRGQSIVPIAGIVQPRPKK
ncbi:unnamed protein product [Sphagnum balticum]